MPEQQTEYYGACTSIRVWYEDGREVEFGIVEPPWISMPLDNGTYRVVAIYDLLPLGVIDILSYSKRQKEVPVLYFLGICGIMISMIFSAFRRTGHKEHFYEIEGVSGFSERKDCGSDWNWRV